MRLSALSPGDLVAVNVRGISFEARFVRVDDLDRAVIEPLSSRITYRRVTARQVVRRIETQQRMGVAA